MVDNFYQSDFIFLSLGKHDISWSPPFKLKCQMNSIRVARGGLVNDHPFYYRNKNLYKMANL